MESSRKPSLLRQKKDLIVLEQPIRDSASEAIKFWTGGQELRDLIHVYSKFSQLHIAFVIFTISALSFT